MYELMRTFTEAESEPFSWAHLKYSLFPNISAAATETDQKFITLVRSLSSILK
jgi:hypothetical protein